MVYDSKQLFVPKELYFTFGELAIKAEKKENIFIIDKELENDLKCSEIIVLADVDSNDQVVDTIHREINLKK
jgi:hypothetical protein